MERYFWPFIVALLLFSVGGAFAYAALSALADAAAELRDKGTYGYLAASAAGRQAAGRAF